MPFRQMGQFFAVYLDPYFIFGFLEFDRTRIANTHMATRHDDGIDFRVKTN